jgi:hypothetical protein
MEMKIFKVTLVANISTHSGRLVSSTQFINNKMHSLPSRTCYKGELFCFTDTYSILLNLTLLNETRRSKRKITPSVPNYLMRPKPLGWPDIHGFDGDLRKNEKEHEEHKIQKHITPGKNRFSLNGPNHRSNRMTRKRPLGRIPWERSTKK